MLLNVQGYVHLSERDDELHDEPSVIIQRVLNRARRRACDWAVVLNLCDCVPCPKRDDDYWRKSQAAVCILSKLFLAESACERAKRQNMIR